MKTRSIMVTYLILFSIISSYAQESPLKKELSQEEKIFGLSLIWKEASYNFAHFEQVPELDWDQAYQKYIPEVLSAESTVEYYNVLIRFCALLRDGHTRIFPPEEYRDYHDEPKVRIINIQKQAIVTDVGESLRDMIPSGSRIMKVSGTPIDDYLINNKFPYISGSTEDILWEVGILTLLKGKKGTKVDITCLTPVGETKDIELVRNSTDVKENWVKAKDKKRQGFEFKQLDDGIAYVALNTFSDSEIIDDFKGILPELRKSKGLIIDLRKNGGGESDIGYAVLQHLIEKPVLTFKWKTREHRASYKAWGKWTSEFPPEELETISEERKEYLRHYKGTACYEGASDTIFPSDETKVIIPMVVLIGKLTASAAEDYLVAVDSVKRAVFVGEKTAGFTGTPLIFDLPGGGFALINTSQEMYPDGRAMRYGIRPDIEVKPTVRDIIEGKDPVLERGIAILDEQVR